jgi:hypothetical protein
MNDAHVPTRVTQLLHQWQDGDREALDRLIPIVYDELRALASRQLAREWRHGRLQATAIVNEAYVRLARHYAVRFALAALLSLASELRWLVMAPKDPLARGHRDLFSPPPTIGSGRRGLQ